MAYGRGEGFALTEQSHSPSVFAGMRAAWEYPARGRLRFRATYDMLAALTRIHFTLDGVDACESPGAAVLVGVGIVGDFSQ
jgi:hypothetical protein